MKAILTWLRQAVCDHRSTHTTTQAKVDDDGMRFVSTVTECTECGKFVPTPLLYQPSPSTIIRLLEGKSP